MTGINMPRTGVSLFAGLFAGGVLAGQALGASAVPEDVMPLQPASKAPNLEPALEHAADEAVATEKLRKFTEATGQRPNILVFLMDDVGWGDLGCYGGGAMLGAPTPVMDSLAREGVQLTSAYSQPSSSPSRATMLTGRLPVRHGILLPPMYGQPGGLNDEITIASMLKQAGYVTQAVGKWHVGENVESQPQNAGFDDFYGFLSVSNMYTEWRDETFYPEVALSPERSRMIEALAFERFLVHTTSAANGGKYEKIREIDIAASRVMDTDLTDYARRFILEMKDSSKPFFLYYGTRGAHFDNYPPDDFRGKSFSKTPYRDTMMELDHHLGTLVQALKDSGQLENTIIFISSDNGPEMESWPDSGFSPFRGAKGSFTEGGVRVPALFYWKDHMPGGRVADGLFDFADIFSTFARIGGASLPSDRYIDGIDQTSFLLSENGQSNRQAVFYWYGPRLAAVRSAEYKQHLLVYDDRPYDVVNNGGFSGSVSAGNRLFNLHTDPKEEHSIMIRKLTHASILEQMSNRHMATFKNYPPKVPIR